MLQIRSTLSRSERSRSSLCKEFPSHSDIDVVLHSNLKHLQVNFFGALRDDREKQKKTYLADRLFKVCTLETLFVRDSGNGPLPIRGLFFSPTSQRLIKLSLSGTKFNPREFRRFVKGLPCLSALQHFEENIHTTSENNLCELFIRCLTIPYVEFGAVHRRLGPWEFIFFCQLAPEHYTRRADFVEFPHCQREQRVANQHFLSTLLKIGIYGKNCLGYRIYLAPEEGYIRGLVRPP